MYFQCIVWILDWFDFESFTFSNLGQAAGFPRAELAQDTRLQGEVREQRGRRLYSRLRDKAPQSLDNMSKDVVVG